MAPRREKKWVMTIYGNIVFSLDSVDCYFCGQVSVEWIWEVGSRMLDCSFSNSIIRDVRMLWLGSLDISHPALGYFSCLGKIGCVF